MNSTQVPGTIELGGPAPEDIQKQLNKIVHSKSFRHASALQRLLQYLISKALEDPFADIKEYTIGMEVFDRGPDYDPQSDTIVRVQIHRLRLKVKEYYETEGIADPILVDVPKGHYIPTFEFRNGSLKTSGTDATAPEKKEPTDIAETPAAALAQPQSPVAGGFFSRGPAIFALALLILAVGIFIGTHWQQWRGGTLSGTAAGRASGGAPRDAATDFWRGFLGNDASPVVGYADAVYLVDGAEDLFRFRRGASDYTGTVVDPHLAQQFASSPGLVARAGPLYYEDGNTGTGDLQSVFVLTRLFTQMGLQMVVKRCRLITIDDLQQHDVILLGSPEENDAVAQLSQPSDFVWNRLDVADPWKGEYVNRRPQPGESVSYKTERDPSTQEIKTDFGLITLQPGAAPNRRIVMLGGLDTSGVAGAAQFVTSPAHMAELRSKLESLSAWKGEGVAPSFQALLRVDVERGNDVFDVHLISVHMVDTQTPGSAGSSANAQSKQQ
ncbi:MAG TPA: hypothetical protein VJS43_09005 [Candidatus Acidoferrales bacterium]|nr:hypothetical protein [Candidatus Acidoferrales bacterium]